MTNTTVTQTSIPVPLIPSSEISKRVGQLSSSISEAYAESEPILVPILHGAFVFAADLVRAIQTPVSIDFLAIRSYVGQASTGRVRILKDLERDIKDRDVLVIEDIVDSGRTLTAILDILSARQPRTLEVVTLLNKKARREANVTARWIGFEIDDRFVVGYGMDLDDRYRNLPYIAEATTPPLHHPN